jgi:hypothetical protein
VERPWTELKHRGEAPWVDDEIRLALARALL